jgi:2-desacetyl-2-hydroxyethyl bacteriochlorophyllide A dehydrogenase
MTLTMRGVWCDGQSAALRVDLPRPEPGPGEVLLRVRLAGICDTDLQLAQGYMGFRGVVGHEFVGELPDGRRATAEINNACHVCPACAAGMPGHCPKRSVLGILNHDGALADFVVVPERNLHAIPPALDDREAVFVEPLAAAFQMLEQAQPGSGTRLAVLGDGKLGQLCARVARTSGASVTLIGKHADKLALAGEGVATRLIDQSADLRRGFDVVIDATGSKTGLPTALGLVRPRGTIVLKTTVAGPYEIDLAPIVIDEIRVLGSRCGPFARAIEALVRREVLVLPLIQSEFALDDADAAFRAAAAPGARKILVRP